MVRCLLFFDGERRSLSVDVTSVNPFLNVRSERLVKGYYMSLMVACDVPVDRIPLAAAFTSMSGCPKRTNHILRVINEQTNNRMNRFGVCVRALYYYHRDISQWMIQWLEMQKILGASKVFFYALALHPDLEKILDFYQDQVSEWTRSF